MPSKPPIFSGHPFTATVRIVQNPVTKKDANDRGYYDIVTHLDEITVLDITLSAATLTELGDKIEGHIGLIE